MHSFTLAAIDIGSGSVKGIVAQKDFSSGEIDVLAAAVHKSLGVRNGEVVYPEQTAQSIRNVVDDLSRESGLKIKEAVVNVGGIHLFSLNSRGLVSVSRADQIIVEEDINRALKEAQVVRLKNNYEIIEVFPREFILDGERGVKEPRGLRASRLEVDVLLAEIFSPVLTNLEKAMALAGLGCAQTYLTPLASARAVVSEEQKELGVAVVDIGFALTALSIFDKGDLVDFAFFPVGSSHITNDLAILLRTEIQTAEQIKKEFGTLKIKEKKAGSEKIKIPEKNLDFSSRFLREVIESRIGEIFGEVQKTFKKIQPTPQLPCGVLLTGGGALLPGLADFVRQKIKLPCRLGEVKDFKGVDAAQFSTCCGLALLTFDEWGDTKGSVGAVARVGRTMKRIFKTFLP